MRSMSRCDTIKLILDMKSVTWRARPGEASRGPSLKKLRVEVWDFRLDEPNPIKVKV